MSVLRFEVRTCADPFDTPDETPYVSLDRAFDAYMEARNDMWDAELFVILSDGRAIQLASKGG